MLSLSLRYMPSEIGIEYKGISQILVSSEKISQKALEEGVQCVMQRPESLELIFFDEQKLYDFAKYICDEIL